MLNYIASLGEYEKRNIIELTNDLQETENYKVNAKELWENIIKYRHNIKHLPLLKHIFNELPNKYNYISYKRNIESNKNIQWYLIDAKNRYGLQAYIILLLHLTAVTYIGFLYEYQLAETLKSKGIKILQNDYLDINKKADIKINGEYIQIKNASFLNNPYLESAITEYYTKHNKALNFAFYTTDANNIYPYLINGNAWIFNKEINGFTFTSLKKVSFEDYIKTIERSIK